MSFIDVEKYHTYARLRWPNQNTRNQYLGYAKRLKHYLIDDKLSQEAINNFLLSLQGRNATNKLNCAHYAFIKGFIECYTDELEESKTKITVLRSTSRQGKIRRDKFLEYEQMIYLERNLTGQLRIMLRLFFDTGLRVSELLDIKTFEIDFGARTMSGIGKGNIPFKVKYIPHTRDILVKWIDKCVDKQRPFLFYHGNGNIPLKNQRAACWYYFVTRCAAVGIKGVYPHRIRHALGYYLRAKKNFDLSQVKEKLRHADIGTTQIYSPATQEEVDKKIDEEIFHVEIKGGRSGE